MSIANIATLWGAVAFGLSAYVHDANGWTVILTAALAGALLGAIAGTIADPHQ